MPECPYKGLEPYQEQDAPRFFGRDRDIRLASENLRASRLTVLCGESGTGKSSLLRAGVAAQLNGASRRRHDLLAVVYQIGRAAPAEGMAAAAREAVGLDEPGADLVRCADHWGGDLLVILDQFEDYFSYHPKDTAFVTELARLLDSREAPVNFMLGIRDDALAQLAHLKSRIPGVLDNLLRIEHLDRQAALDAMLRPLEDTPVKLDPALAEEVCGEIIRAQGEGRERVPAPFLQLVMTRWWDEDNQTGELTAATLHDRLGGVTKVFQTHFAGSMRKLSGRERRTAVTIFGPMVTSGGRKIAQTVSELSAGRGEPKSEVRTLLEKLRREHILTVVPTPPHLAEDDTCYEFAHDVLAKEGFEWRRRHEQSRIRKIVCALGVIAGVVVTTLLVTGWALKERKAAIAEKLTVRQRELALQADGRLPGDPELAVLIASYALAEAGRLRVRGAEEAKAALHRALQACPLATLRIAKVWLNGVTFASDGQRVAATSSDGTFWIRDLENGSQWKKFEGHQGPVTAVAFTPDGRRVITAGDGKRARIWDVGTGTEIRRLEGEAAIRAVAFSPDGAKVATAGDQGTGALWDAVTGEPVARLKGHAGAVRTVAFQPSGLWLATAGDDQMARLWDAVTGKPVRSFPTHSAGVRRIVFSPDSRWLTTASADGTVRLWKPNDVMAATVLRGHAREVTAVAFSPDSGRLATADADGAVRVWDVESGAVLQALEGHRGTPVLALSYGRDGLRVATGRNDGAVRIWPGAPMEVALLRGDASALALAFSPGGAYLAASFGGMVNLWDTETWSSRQLARHDGNIRGLAFSPDDRRLATASDDQTAKEWDVRTAGELLSLQHDSRVYGVAFHGSGPTIATIGWDGTLLLWDAGGHKLSTPGLPASLVGLVAFSSNGERLVSVRAQGIAISGVHPAKDLRQFPLNPDSVLNVCASPDGKRIAVGILDGPLKLFDAVAGGQGLLGNTSKAPWGVAFSPDGRQLATAGNDKAVKVWDLDSKEEILTLRLHDSPVEKIAFSPDGRFLASSDTDGVVHVYAYGTSALLSLARKRLGGRELSQEECRDYLKTPQCPPAPRL